MFKKKPSTPPQTDELDLKSQRPRAGELRRFPTGEALFFSPLPAPTGATPMDFDGHFLAVNEVYLDVGTSNYNKAFQTQLMVCGRRWCRSDCARTARPPGWSIWSVSAG